MPAYSRKSVSSPKARSVEQRAWSQSASGGIIVFTPKSLLTVLLTLVLTMSAKADAELYRNTLKGTVWIRNERKKCAGSGALVDRSRRLLVTNEHVVEKADHVMVYFPAFEDGDLVISRKRYLDETSSCRRSLGEVVARDPVRDLALVRLESLPLAAKPLPISRDIQPGATVHVVGNPGVSPLWTYARGWVRSVGARTLNVSGRKLAARLVEFDSSIYPGNSGGPVVNDKGELVGIVAAGNQTFNFAVHATELLSLVDKLRLLAVVTINNCT